MFYSAKKNTWFDPNFRAKYEANNAWPDDAKEYSRDVYDAVVSNRPENKIMVPDDSGCPTLVDMLPPVRTRDSLLDEISAKRWQVETGGIFVSGIHAATDRESQAQLNNVYTSLKAGLITETSWKDAEGGFTMITLAELEPVAHAVATHVSACFAAEQAHSEAINLLQHQDDIDAYDIESGWPANK